MGNLGVFVEVRQPLSPPKGERISESHCKTPVSYRASRLITHILYVLDDCGLTSVNVLHVG